MLRIPRFLLLVPTVFCLDFTATTALANHRQDNSTEMTAWYQKRQIELHDKLKLTIEQEATWKMYVRQSLPPPMKHFDYWAPYPSC